MNLLFFFVSAFCVTSHTCYGKGLKQQPGSPHIVFISSVVAPNDHEMNELKNLLAFPTASFNGTNRPPIPPRQMLYQIIFSSKPDDIVTVSASDKKPHSMSYFESLIKNRTTKSSKAASLKGLRKALEITSASALGVSMLQDCESIIVLITNTKPEDTYLLKGILDTMMKKKVLVHVLQIDKHSSLPAKPFINDVSDVCKSINVYSTNNAGKVNLPMEYKKIMSATEEISLGNAIRTLYRVNTGEIPDLPSKKPQGSFWEEDEDDDDGDDYE